VLPVTLAKISPIVTQRGGCIGPPTRRRANRFGADSRVLRLAEAIERRAEAIWRKIFFAW
jgi:hypothetical protein